MKLAVVLDVAWPFRQRVHPSASGSGPRCQTFRLLNIGQQLKIHRFRSYTICTGIVMHLLEVRPIAKPPCLGQGLGLAAIWDVVGKLGFVEEPGKFSPSAQSFFKLNAVGPRCAYKNR